MSTHVRSSLNGATQRVAVHALLVEQTSRLYFFECTSQTEHKTSTSHKN